MKMNELTQTDFKEVDWDEVLDYEDIRIDPSLPVEDKFNQLCEMTPYPFHLKTNGFKVILSFNGKGESVAEQAENYVRSLVEPTV